MGLVELLVSHDAEISSVPFVEVLLLWDPTIIRYFLDHGADFITGYPFAEAFAERIRTALGPWRECKEKYPHLAPQLQEQADRALRYFCFKDDLKWVSLLMWAGADPRSSGPPWGDDEDFDDEEYSSALTEDERHERLYRQHLLQELARRYDREKIYQEIWSEPMQHVAKRYNLSDVGLAKVCRKLNIPRPGRGYWAIKVAGKTTPRRPPLLALSI